MRSSVAVKLLWIVVVAIAALSAVDSASTNEVIGDGDFELGSVHETSGNARTYDGWAASRARGGGTIAPVSSPVFSGSQAVQIDTRTATIGRSIYQDLRDATGCFTWTFHIYPVQGEHVAEMIYSWRGDNGPLKDVSSLDYGDNGIAFTGWNASTNVAQVLSPGQWHEITVKADAVTRVQKLLVDGSQLAELTATDANVVPDTVIIGDVAGNAFKSLYTYDDVSLQTEACTNMPTPTPTATPTVTATATATPTVTLPATPLTWLWGDFDCFGSLTIGDAQKIARYLISLAITQGTDCPQPNQEVAVNGTPRMWGDLDCMNGLTIGDAQKTARKLVNLPVGQAQGCPAPGDAIQVQT